MKQVLFAVFMLLAVQNAFCQTIGDAFYVYRNDDSFHVFYRSEVDSMAYSCYDTDSVLYDSEVTQVIYTRDSIYRIPINAIDSIAFVTPSTIYRQGVIVIDDKLRQYVTSHDSLTFTLSPSTPAKTIPRVGNKLVTTTMDDMFPIGFIGEVSSVQQTNGEWEVQCTAVVLEDVFERYFGVANTPLVDAAKRKAAGNASGKYDENVIFAPGTLKYDLLHVPSIPDGFAISYERNDGLSISVSDANAKIECSLNPVLRGRTNVIVSPQTGTYISFSVVGDFQLKQFLFLSGKVEASKDFNFWSSPPVYVPNSPLVFFTIDVGGFVKAAGEISCQQNWQQDYRSHFFWEYSSKGEKSLNPQNRILPKEKSTTHDGYSFVNGNIGCGLYIEAGFDLLVKDIASARLREELGLNYTNNYVLTKKDLESAKTSTATYEKLRDSRWSLNLLTQLSFTANVWKWSVSKDINLPLVNNNVELMSGCHVPYIEEFKIDEDLIRIDGSNWLRAKLRKGTWKPVNINLVFFDEDGNEAYPGKWTILRNSMGEQEETQHEEYIDKQWYYNGVFGRFEPGHTYRVYPCLELLSDESGKYVGRYSILASPSDSMIMYTSQCPDEKHPHLIDLGLPSGTKWACCNIGASGPTENGGYYAWGEIKEKSDYSPATYQYADTNHGGYVDPQDGKAYHYIDIGPDISGDARYDAATANWGEEWCMPTCEQWEELRQYAQESQILIEANNILITGFARPGHAQAIVLPRQGYKAYQNVYDMSTLISPGYIDSGHYDYWTSTRYGDAAILYHWFDYNKNQDQYVYSSEEAFFMSESNSLKGTLWEYNKHCGLSIRPVQSSKPSNP